MPKTILTDRDIENLARRGQAELLLDGDTLLTDLAYEKASQLGIKLKSAPPTIVRPDLSQSTGPVPSPARNLLHFSPQAGEVELRRAIIETGRIAYESGLMISNDGNISVRLADGNILITPAGVCKGRINPQDLLVVDLNGKMVEPAADWP